jgi:hypothetical protein
MNANAKSTMMEETLEAICNPITYLSLYQKGLERMVEAGKITLNMSAQQNNDILAAMKKALKSTQLDLSGLDLASQAFEGYIAIQKNMLDMALEQTASLIESIEECLSDSSKAKSELANMMQLTVDRSINAQNTVVDFASRQAKAVNENLKSQPGLAGTQIASVADTIQRGFDTVISTQKEILNIAAKPMKAAVARA